MICAQTRLRFQFAESRQNTTRTMGFQTKVTRGALVQPPPPLMFPISYFLLAFFLGKFCPCGDWVGSKTRNYIWEGIETQRHDEPIESQFAS